MKRTGPAITIPALVWWVTLSLLAGCATRTDAPEQSNRYEDLYDGLPRVIFATSMPVESAEEAIARGDLALRHGNSDRALFEYLQALAAEGAHVTDTLAKIGAIHADRGNLRLAQLAYMRALERSPTHAGALEGLGLVLLEARQREEAVGYLAQAVAADGSRWRAHNALGIVADLKGEYDVAAEHYEQALRLRPNSATILNNLGYSRYLAGDWEGAEQQLRKAITADPRQDRAQRNLALLYVRRGRYEEALELFGKLMNPAEAYNAVGYVCMLDGKHERAEAFFKEAIRLSPSYFGAAHQNLARNHAFLR